jgi:hypothetical protein
MWRSHFWLQAMHDYVGKGGCGKNTCPRAAMAALAATAGVAELADALDLGSSDANRGGSSPPARTRSRLTRQ